MASASCCSITDGFMFCSIFAKLMGFYGSTFISASFSVLLWYVEFLIFRPSYIGLVWISNKQPFSSFISLLPLAASLSRFIHNLCNQSTFSFSDKSFHNSTFFFYSLDVVLSFCPWPTQVLSPAFISKPFSKTFGFQFYCSLHLLGPPRCVAFWTATHQFYIFIFLSKVSSAIFFHSIVKHFPHFF